MSTKTLMTAQEFAQMQTPETEDFELVDGELIRLPSGTPRHANIRGLTEHKVRSYFERSPIGQVYGEMDCRLNEDTVRRSDLAIFLGAGRLQQMDQDQVPTPFAPDIAVEGLSPSERAMDARRKVRDYLRAGSEEVWLLDHANGEVLVHTGKGIRVLQGTDVLDSPLLPGFAVAVADLVLKPY
jgi:Uma2 family endonuclease